MKNTLRTCCAIALISPLCAGEPAPAPSTPPTTYDSYCWFLGGGGDYLFDSEEIYWNGHIGYNFSDSSSIFLEAGWIGSDDEVTVATEGSINDEPVIILEDTNIDIDIVPVTLNYKYEWALGDRLAWYLGVGAGAANIDVEVGGFGSDDEWTFMAQAFTGLVYEFTPAFEGYLGVRYMWFDEPDFGDDGDLGDFDDWGAGLGLRFNF
ncbi:MAG: outer membrane beta-barrel protein [Luteolibacter sp.]|nr:outer membrane beta-barrel protein [Luteolibacter sp.]